MKARSRRFAEAGAAPVYSVGELNRSVRLLIEREFPEVWVEGEVSNLRLQSSGHCYFTLKDGDAQLACVMFRAQASRLREPLVDGMQLQVCGELSLYEARGQFQMIVRRVQGQGAGLLHAKFEALKRKLEGEGMFDAQKKKPLPMFPVRVGLVTSASGAAIRDMLQVLRRRAPWISVLLAPARVQGEGASDDLIRGLRWLDDTEAMGLPPVDLIILGRGGGSLEDLWPFNEEAVARAIVECRLPVVSAVGHEIDFTISDFVADLRAPTPSAAAELVAPDRAGLIDQLHAQRERMRRMLFSWLERERFRWQRLSEGALKREPERRLEEYRQRLDQCMESLRRAIAYRLEREHAHLEQLSRRVQAQSPSNRLRETRRELQSLRANLAGLVYRGLESLRERLASRDRMLRSLGPQRVLERGYSMVFEAEGRLVRSVERLVPGQPVKIRFADGETGARVSERQENLHRQPRTLHGSDA